MSAFLSCDTCTGRFNFNSNFFFSFFFFFSPKVTISFSRGLVFAVPIPPCIEVLKVGGVLWIAEVRSRFDGSAGHASVESFLAVCAELGFKLKGQPDESNKMFFIVHLVKDKDPKDGPGPATKGGGKAGRKGGGGKPGLRWPKLKACIYKRR